VAGNGQAELAQLRGFFQRLPQVKARLLQAAAAEALTQVKFGFRRSEAPDGTAWAPLKHRDGMPLRDTGRLGNSFTAKVAGDHVIVGTNVVYAPYHQFGTEGRKVDQTRFAAIDKRGRFMSKSKAEKSKKLVGVRALTFRAGTGGIPARPMLPLNGLPERWKKAIDRAINKALVNFVRELNPPK
jgi:phage virion morphogenesis protein